MTCVECQERLQRMLDGRHEEGASVAGQVADCPKCGEMQRAANRLREGLLHFDVPQLPHNFAARVVTRVLLDRQARRSRRRRWFVVTALAASLLLAVSAGYYWFCKVDANSNFVEPAPLA